MDIPRTGQAQKRRMKRTAIGVGIGAAVLLVTFGLARLEPAAPPVKKETVWIEAVQRGPMLRAVRGPGTLVPEDVRSISAPVEGTIERIPALPGARVEPDTVLLEMSDPEVMQNAFQAESQLRAAEADYANLRARLESEFLSQQSQVATIESQAEQANLQVEAEERLFKDELIPELTLKLSRLRADQLTKQAQIETERLGKIRSSQQAQLSAQQAQVNQMRALYGLRQRQVDSLKVRAGIPGVLQELPMVVGQRVTPGTTLARVARPEKLKAELRIPETLAKDVAVGLQAQIDTRNGVVAGRVTRVAPSAQDGTVIVDVAMEGPLPKGARPNLSVDGTIEIERLDNVLFVGRPTYGQPNQKIELFKVVKEGEEAVRVPVQLGRSSFNTIEIVSGLDVGDRVILSDTSAQDGYDRIRLE